MTIQAGQPISASDFIETSSGATDEGKVAKLNSTGVLDESVIPFNYIKTISYSNGIVTKDITEASTTQTIAHGLGSAPKKVILYSVVKPSTDPFQTCKGVYDSSGQNYILGSGDNFITSGSGACIKIYENSTNSGSDTQTGVVTVDSTNITITWTRSGTMSNPATATILWEAETNTI